MHTTYTSVLARRVRIGSDFATLPYEAGWATEAVFFTQVEGDHPELEISTDISPDGINWVRRNNPQTLAADEFITDNNLTVFGSWVRLRITGASEHTPARILVHLNLKG